MKKKSFEKKGDTPLFRSPDQTILKEFWLYYSMKTNDFELILMLFLDSSPHQKTPKSKISCAQHLLFRSYWRKRKFKMADFGTARQNRSNFQMTISLERSKLWPWNFQGCLFSLISPIGENFIKIWDIRVTIFKNIGWFDMELPIRVCVFPVNLVGWVM